MIFWLMFTCVKMIGNRLFEHTSDGFYPSQSISMQILLIFCARNKVFGNKNKANDHTEEFT